MNGIAVLLALAAVGVDYGWQPGADGQLEYIIQIEPASLEALKSGRDITSEIHPDARGVRRFRIHYGTGSLPRVGVLSSNTSPTRLSTTDTDPSASVGGSSLAPSGSGLGSQTGMGTTITDERTGAAGSSRGTLDLPPPPALIGPDGKASVLVRPGDRALPGGPVTAQPEGPAYDSVPLDSGAGNRWTVPTPPGTGQSDWSSSTSPVTVPSGASGGFGPQNPGGFAPQNPGGFAPQNPGGFFPVPGAVPGPQTGLPEPIRGAGVAPDSAGDIEKTASDGSGGSGTASELAGQLASNSTPAAAQKPAIDDAEAEKLIDEEATRRAKQMQAEHPWPPLVFTSLALFGSIAGNVYLGWIASGIYRRYRDMCDELHEAQTSLT